MSTDLLDLEQFGPQLRQQGLGFPFGCLVATADQRTFVRRWQGLAVQLAVGRQRQALKAHVGHGYHVFRQLRVQMPTQRVDPLHRPFEGRGEIGHQALVAWGLFTAQHHGLLDFGMFGQTRFDLAQLDPEATDLHLGVIAPQVFQVAIGTPAHQIAGAVQARQWVAVERVGDEFFPGQILAVQVTLGHTRATDIQLSHHPQRHGLALGIEYIKTGVADGSANRQAATVRPGDLVGRGEGRGFGRAVAIEQVLWSSVRQYPRDHRRVQHITADNQVTQARESIAQARGVLMEQPGGHPQHRHRLLQQQALEIFRGEQVGLADHHHAAAIEQRRPDVKGAGVECRVGGEGHPVPGIEVGITVVDHQTADSPMRHQNTLGGAGGAGGVHDVGHAFAGLRHRQVIAVQALQTLPVEVNALHAGVQRHLAASQQDPCLAVLDHEALAFHRGVDIQRDIDRAALERRQLADQQLMGPFQQDRHAVARLYTETAQMPSQAVGPGVELGIA
ncbi:hypothetical protein UCMB321_5574 [Pseudomonas batumici]|uniref:Uncharacterized protein n=1 Tax=Pseudomonas batumici TaxID=226910 RepID=A0A0C2I184_9PSED|nr:hypothetical protein UCMB321_5574 [Pseudomonas batumici]